MVSRLVVNIWPPTFSFSIFEKWTCSSFFAISSKASFSLRSLFVSCFRMLWTSLIFFKFLKGSIAGWILYILRLRRRHLSSARDRMICFLAWPLCLSDNSCLPLDSQICNSNFCNFSWYYAFEPQACIVMSQKTTQGGLNTNYKW